LYNRKASVSRSVSAASRKRRRTSSDQASIAVRVYSGTDNARGGRDGTLRVDRFRGVALRDRGNPVGRRSNPPDRSGTPIRDRSRGHGARHRSRNLQSRTADFGAGGPPRGGRAPRPARHPARHGKRSVVSGGLPEPPRRRGTALRGLAPVGLRNRSPGRPPGQTRRPGNRWIKFGVVGGMESALEGRDISRQERLGTVLSAIARTVAESLELKAVFSRVAEAARQGLPFDVMGRTLLHDPDLPWNDLENVTFSAYAVAGQMRAAQGRP